MKVCAKHSSLFKAEQGMFPNIEGENKYMQHNTKQTWAALPWIETHTYGCSENREVPESSR